MKTQKIRFRSALHCRDTERSFVGLACFLVTATCVPTVALPASQVGAARLERLETVSALPLLACDTGLEASSGDRLVALELHRHRPGGGEVRVRQVDQSACELTDHPAQLARAGLY